MDNLILSTIAMESLLHSFREIIREEIKAEQHGRLQEKLLTTTEVCSLFGVSSVTISNWTNQGLLIKHTKGGRNYFKYSEVIESLKTVKKYKTKYKSYLPALN